MATYFLAAVVSALYVFFKGFQNLNGVFKKKGWVPALSYCISFCEVFIISSVATGATSIWSGIGLALALGTGGWVGYLLCMWLHPKLTGKYYG